jgi:hypothetical protein
MKQSIPASGSTKAPAPLTRCYICSVEPSEAQFLKKVRKPFRFRYVGVCPDCLPTHARKDLVAAIAWLILLFVMLQVFNGRFDLGILTDGLALVLGLLLSMPIALALHEAAHAVVAKAMGWQIHGLFLGVGKLLWQGRRKDAVWQVRRLMAAGMVWAVPRNSASIMMPLQAFLVFAVGPAINLALGYPALVYRFTAGASMQPTLLVDLLFLFGCINIGMGVGNLLPFTVFNCGLAQHSDGKHILLALFQPSKLRTAYQTAEGLMHVLALRQLGDLERARDFAIAVLERHPHNLVAVLNASALLLETRDYSRGVEMARRGLHLLGSGPAVYDPIFGAQQEVAEKLFKAMLHCNLAYGLLRLEDPVSDEAITYASQAYAALPWQPNVQMLQGYSLARQGQPKAGLKLYETARKHWNEFPETLRRQYKQTQQEIEAMAVNSDHDHAQNNFT